MRFLKRDVDDGSGPILAIASEADALLGTGADDSLRSLLCGRCRDESPWSPAPRGARDPDEEEEEDADTEEYPYEDEDDLDEDLDEDLDDDEDLDEDLDEDEDF